MLGIWYDSTFHFISFMVVSDNFFTVQRHVDYWQKISCVRIIRINQSWAVDQEQGIFWPKCTPTQRGIQTLPCSTWRCLPTEELFWSSTFACFLSSEYNIWHLWVHHNSPKINPFAVSTFHKQTLDNFFKIKTRKNPFLRFLLMCLKR